MLRELFMLLRLMSKMRQVMKVMKGAIIGTSVGMEVRTRF